MKFIYTLCALSFAALSVAYPVDVRSNDISLSPAEIEDRSILLDDLKTLATSKAVGGVKVTASSVNTAASNFAKDANTVSASINTMGDTTDAKTLKSLATTAFNAESDEYAQRAVLAAAAEDAGAASNAKIVKNTLTVLTGLQNIMNSPTTGTAPKNLAATQKAG